MPKPKNFTVIGFYEETGQTFAFEIEAEDPHAAIATACDGKWIDMSWPSDVCVVGAVAGAVTLTAPCDESGKVAYGSDLTTDKEECEDCGGEFAELIGCPDGAEICQACFDAGAH